MIVEIVRCIAPGYGGINLEDIAAPRCFEIERQLRDILDIPVFHDDQHGTAIVVLAALTNALRVVKKTPQSVRVVVSGVGAAGRAIIQLLHRQGFSRHHRLRPQRRDPARQPQPRRIPAMDRRHHQPPRRPGQPFRDARRR